MKEDILKNQGYGVKIAVIDSGVLASHSFFRDTSIKQFAIKDDQFEEVSPSDPYGHGTACVGIIHKYVKNAQIYVLQCFNENGMSTGEYILKAMEWCIHNNINIINMSFGALMDQHGEEFRKIGEKCRNNNILIFAACHDTGYMAIPAKYDGFLAVWGKSVKEKYTYYYQNERFITQGGRQIVCWNNGKYVYADGSSFATARMSGMAAKIIGFYPNKTYNEYIGILYELASKSEIEVSPMIKDSVVEANAKKIDIKNAAIYSYTKEIETLLNFRELLNFNVKSIIDLPKKVTNIMVKDIKTFKTINKESLKDVDTLIISRTSIYESITQRDMLKEILESALNMGVNIFSLEYIDKNMYSDLFEKAKTKGLRIRHPILGEDDYAESQLFREIYGHIGTKIPVVGVFGTGKAQGKFTTQLMLRKIFKENGYNVCNFGTETHCELFGFEGMCPLEMDASIRFPREQILRFIQGKMREIEIKNNPDLIIVGGQSGVVPYTYGLKDDEYTIPTLTFLMATIPHIYILCINSWDDREYIKDTIHVLESLGKGKVIALVSSKISKIVEKNMATIRKTILSENEYDIIKEEMKELFSLPLYDILDPKDAKQLFFQIIKYFKGEI